jgi:hypothetical protein
MSGPVQPPEKAIDLPQHLLDVASKEPATIDRPSGAALIRKHMFPVSDRTVGGWPLPWEYPNGRAVAPPATYLAYAYRKSREAKRCNPRQA